MSEKSKVFDFEEVFEFVRKLRPDLNEEAIRSETQRLLGIVSDVVLEAQTPKEFKGGISKTSQ